MHFPHRLAQVMRDGLAEVAQPYTGRIRLVSLDPADVHTVVLWSKDFFPLLADRGGVRRALDRYEQLFCHLTVTGLGGTPLEPSVRPWGQVIQQLPELIELVGHPRRVTVRFDPIVHWRQAGEITSNFPLAREILRRCAGYGVDTIRVSFATLYRKVRRRKGWDWYDPALPERLGMISDLVSVAEPLGLTVYACSDRSSREAGAEASRCIDGELLTELHPRHLSAPTGRDKGQRAECGCSPSVDIGSYTMRCPNGCRYCYANPVILHDRPPATVGATTSVH